MKKIVIVFMVLMFSSSIMVAKDSTNFKSISLGAGYMFGNQPNADFGTIELNLHELISDKFVVGINTLLSIPFDETSPEIGGFKASLGMFSFGDANSKFKTLISISSGFVGTTIDDPLFEDDTYYGNISTIDLNIFFSSLSLSLSAYTINTKNYYNSGGNIGLKYWF